MGGMGEVWDRRTSRRVRQYSGFAYLYGAFLVVVHAGVADAYDLRDGPDADPLWSAAHGGVSHHRFDWQLGHLIVSDDTGDSDEMLFLVYDVTSGNEVSRFTAAVPDGLPRVMAGHAFWPDTQGKLSEVPCLDFQSGELRTVELGLPESWDMWKLNKGCTRHLFLRGGEDDKAFNEAVVYTMY